VDTDVVEREREAAPGEPSSNKMEASGSLVDLVPGDRTKHCTRWMAELKSTTRTRMVEDGTQNHWQDPAPGAPVRLRQDECRATVHNHGTHNKECRVLPVEKEQDRTTRKEKEWEPVLFCLLRRGIHGRKAIGKDSKSQRWDLAPAARMTVCASPANRFASRR
jgi:hypothetical protein